MYRGYRFPNSVPDTEMPSSIVQNRLKAHLFFSHFLGQTDYTVYRTASTWMAASQACYLATPGINISTEGDYSVNIPNSDIQLTKGVNYWVGYHKSHRVFQYEG